MQRQYMYSVILPFIRKVTLDSHIKYIALYVLSSMVALEDVNHFPVLQLQS